MKTKLLLLLPPLAVALVSLFVVRTQQGQGANLVARQQQAQALTPAKVAAVVRLAPDPATGKAGRSATCVPLGSGELHNPWRCTISYRSGPIIQYTVTLSADGAFTGSQEVVQDQGATKRSDGRVRGCCVLIP